MNKSAIAFTCALFLANVSLADTTIAASKALDARVDVGGNKGGEWCDKQISLKFLTTDGKELSQSAYDQMLPKVQSLLTSQCAKVANVDISRGKTVEKFSYANGEWTSAGSEAVKVAELDNTKPVDSKTEKALDKETKWQDDYFDLLNQGDFKKVVKKFTNNGHFFSYRETGLGFDRTAGYGKFGVYEDIIKNSKIAERKIIDIQRDRDWTKIIVEEKGAYKSDDRNYIYTAKDIYEWNNYHKTVSVINREMLDYQELEVATKEPKNFGHLEQMALLAKTPLENEIYLSYYVAIKNEQTCKQYSRALKSNNLNDINLILSKNEKEAKAYQDKVKSLKEFSLLEESMLSLSRNDYDEQLGGIKLNHQVLKNINPFSIEKACDIQISPFKYATFSSLNVDLIPVTPRMLTPITQDNKYLIDIRFSPVIKEIEGKKIIVISANKVKLTHIKTNTVVVDQTISRNVVNKAFDNYIEVQTKRHIEYDNLSDECKTMKWLGGGKGCK